MMDLPRMHVVNGESGPELSCSHCGPVSMGGSAVTVARLLHAERRHYRWAHGVVEADKREARAQQDVWDRLRTTVLLLGALHEPALALAAEGRWDRSSDPVEAATFNAVHNSMGLLSLLLRTIGEEQAKQA